MSDEDGSSGLNAFKNGWAGCLVSGANHILGDVDCALSGVF